MSENLLGIPRPVLPVDPAARLLDEGVAADQVAAANPTSSLAWATLAEDAPQIDPAARTEHEAYISIGLAVASAAVSVIALAQTATPAKSAAEAKTVIEARQKVFEDMKKAYEPLTDMLKRKREFDAALVATNSAQIQVLAQKIPAHLAVDTHTFKDTETLARDNIWTNLADIKAKSDALIAAAGNVANRS